MDYLQLLMIGQAGRWTRTLSATPLQPKNKMLIFGLPSTSDDHPGWSVDSEPICQPSWAKKIKCSFLDYLQLLIITQAGQWARNPSATPLQPKNKMLIFGLRSISDDRPGWLMDLNPLCHPSPVKKIKCSFLDYIQLLMIGQAVQWTRTPSTTLLQAQIWNAGFLITFNFWWLAVLVGGLKTHPLPIYSQKNKMLIFGLRSTSDDRLD